MNGMLLFTKVITCCFIWLDSEDSHLANSVWNLPLGNRNHHFQNHHHIFRYRMKKNLSKPGIFLSATWSVTARKTFLSSVSILKILAIGHWFLWHSCWNSNISSTVKFGVCFSHFCLVCRPCRNSFLPLFQKCAAAMCWTHCHRFFLINIRLTGFSR